MKAIAYNFVMNFVVTGLTLAGAALPQLVVASDCGTPVDQLTDDFAVKSLNPFPQYLRWYFAAGMSSGSHAMSIQLYHVTNVGLLQLLHKPAKEPQKIRRLWRLLFRFGVTTMWVMLPLARDNLNSLQLIAIITGSCYLMLFIEVYGQAPKELKMVDWYNEGEEGYEQVHGGDHRFIRTIYGVF
jgi:hypothetical protein